MREHTPDHEEVTMMLKGYGLTLAKFTYGMPDHPDVLQELSLQQFDLAPNFPWLHGFISFWRTTLVGPLRHVAYTHHRLIGPNEWRSVKGEFLVN